MDPFIYSLAMPYLLPRDVPLRTNRAGVIKILHKASCLDVERALMQLDAGVPYYGKDFTIANSQVKDSTHEAKGQDSDDHSEEGA